MTFMQLMVERENRRKVSRNAKRKNLRKILRKKERKEKRKKKSERKRRAAQKRKLERAPRDPPDSECESVGEFIDRHPPLNVPRPCVPGRETGCHVPKPRKKEDRHTERKGKKH